MNDLEKREAARILIEQVNACFFQVVPENYQTFCVLVSKISQFVLKASGLSAQLTACQLWYTSAEINYAVGFTGVERPAKWDGHVICTCHGYFIDASTAQLRNKDTAVPRVVSGPMMPAFASVMARYAIDRERSVWWHRPPTKGARASMPAEPPELIALYGNRLLNRINDST